MSSGDPELDRSMASERSTGRSRGQRDNNGGGKEDDLPEMDEEEYDEEWEHEWEDIDVDIFSFDPAKRNLTARNMHNGRGRGYIRGRGRGRARGRGQGKFVKNWDHKTFYRDSTDTFGDTSRKSRGGFDADDIVEEELSMPPGIEMTNLKVKIQDGKRFAEPEGTEQRYSNYKGRYQRGKYLRGHQRSRSPGLRDHSTRTAHSESSRDSILDCREVLNRRKRLHPDCNDGDLREKLRRRDKDVTNVRLRHPSPLPDIIDPRDLIEPPDMHLIESHYMNDPPEAHVEMDFNNGGRYWKSPDHLLDSEMSGEWKGSEENIGSLQDQELEQHSVPRRSVERFREQIRMEERRSVRDGRSEDKFDTRSVDRFEGRITVNQLDGRRTPDIFVGRRTPDLIEERRTPGRFEVRRSPDRFEGRSPNQFGGRRGPGRFVGRRSPDRFGGRSPDRFGGRRSPNQFGGRRSPNHFGGRRSQDGFEGRRSPNRFRGRSPGRFEGRSPDQFEGRRTPDQFEGRSPDQLERRTPDRFPSRSPNLFDGRRSPDRFEERRSSDQYEGRRSPARFERSVDPFKGRRTPVQFDGRSSDESVGRRSLDRFKERTSRERFEGRVSVTQFEERRVDRFTDRGPVNRFEKIRFVKQESMEPYVNPVSPEPFHDSRNTKPFEDQISSDTLNDRSSVERFVDKKNAERPNNQRFIGEHRVADKFQEKGSYGRNGSKTAAASRVQPIQEKRDIRGEEERRPGKKFFDKDKRDKSSSSERREERRHDSWVQNKGQGKSLDSKERFGIGWQTKNRETPQFIQHDSKAVQELDVDRKRFKGVEQDSERIREKDKDGDKDRVRERNRAKDKDNDRYRDRERSSDKARLQPKERSREGERDRDKDRGRDKVVSRDKARERDGERESNRGREINRERDRNRERINNRNCEEEKERVQDRERTRNQAQGKESERRNTSERDSVHDATRIRERSPVRYHRYEDSKFEPKSDRLPKPADWTRPTEPKNTRQREHTSPSRDWERIRDNQEKRESHSIPFLDDSKGVKELASLKHKLVSEKGNKTSAPFLDPELSQKNSRAGWSSKAGPDSWRKEDLGRPSKWQATNERHVSHGLENLDSRERNRQHRGNPHQRSDPQNVAQRDAQKLLDNSHRKPNGCTDGEFWQRRSYTPSGDHQWEMSRPKLEQSGSRANLVPAEAAGSSKVSRPLDKNALNPPREVIIVRGLAEDIKEDDIRKDISSCGLWPKEVRLVLNNDSGTSRGFAFITFNSVDEASRWMELRNGVLKLRPMNHAVMDYSIRNSRDWDCKRCETQNFRFRTNCHICNRPKEDCLDGWDEVSPYPTNALILRGLNPSTNSSCVAKALEPHVWSKSAPRLDSVQMGVDSQGNQRGVCFVHCPSVVDSIDLHKSLATKPLILDGSPVVVSYCLLNRLPPTMDRDSGNARAFGSANVDMTLPNTLQPNLSSINVGLRPNPAVVNPVHPSTGVSQEALRSMLEGNYTEKDIPTLAVYCATAYAKTPQEQAAYVRYYTQHYKDKLQKGNAGTK